MALAARSVAHRTSRRTVLGRSLGVSALVVTVLAVYLSVQDSSSIAATPATMAAVGSSTQPGVYAGPGSKDVTGAAAFDAATGQVTTEILDFEDDSSWTPIEGPAWLLQTHAGNPYRLELSVPLFPSAPASSLAECATGAYSAHWTALAQHLVSAGLSTTIVRPGWEFNGNWYRWSALNDPAAFASCFRNLVTGMRAVPGQQFAFDWNVAAGVHVDSALAAWPGSAYVDYVGLDLYDLSWNNYVAGTTPSAAAQAASVRWLVEGTGGLRFWSSFAASKGVKFSLPEWGVTWRPDGHGGGDDPTFINALFDAFQGKTGLAEPIAYEHYFNVSGSATDHQLTAPTRFPNSVATFKTRMLGVQANSAASLGPTSSQPSTLATSTTPAKAATPVKPGTLTRSLRSFAHAPRPALRGVPTVGRTLRVVVGSWAPRPVLRYQWFANGQAVAHATKSTFRIPSSCRGKRLTVRVRGTRSGYQPATRVTKSTAKIGPRRSF